MLERARKIWRLLWNMLVELNLFETATASSNPFELVTGRIKTRVYLISLALSMGILISYTSISLRVQNITVQNPSVDHFNMLYDKYRSTLHCPCSQITIEYGSFMSIAPVFHPVCESWLVSPNWTEFLTTTLGELAYEKDDFRKHATSFFTALASLCELSNTAITNAWRVFSHFTLYGDEALSRNYFQAFINQTLSRFQDRTTKEFKSSFAIIALQTQSILDAQGNSVT